MGQTEIQWNTQTQLRSAALDKSSKQTAVKKIHQYDGMIKNGQTKGEKSKRQTGSEGHRAWLRRADVYLCLRKTISPLCEDQCLERKALMGTECHYHLRSGSSCTQDTCRASGRKRRNMHVSDSS